MRVYKYIKSLVCSLFGTATMISYSFSSEIPVFDINSTCSELAAHETATAEKAQQEKIRNGYKPLNNENTKNTYVIMFNDCVSRNQDAYDILSMAWNDADQTDIDLCVVYSKAGSPYYRYESLKYCLIPRIYAKNALKRKAFTP